jgi:hypothetical protein
MGEEMNTSDRGGQESLACNPKGFWSRENRLTVLDKPTKGSKKLVDMTLNFGGIGK